MIKFKHSLIIVLVFAIQHISFSQTNIDFETGNLNGWTGYIGANMNSNVSFTSCLTTVNQPLNGTNLNMIVKSYFSMMTTAAPADPYGGFALTSPLGGVDVIRLGNENTNVNEGGDCSTPKNCSNTGPAYCSTICGTPVGSSYIESPAEAVIQTFAVTSANALLTYAWAAVLNDGGHPTGEEPYFEVKIYNQSGVEQTCFTNRIIQKTGVTTPGWTKSATKNCWYGSSPAMDVYYKSWTTVNVLLSNYIGQNVTVRFAVAGCVDGGHFGYAYFDAKTGPATITPSNASPCGSQTLTLSAPAGVSGPYSWTGPGIVSGASTATVTVNAAGTYTQSVGTGTCVATMTATVTYSGGPSVTASAGSPTICNGGGPVILTAGGATTYTWSANAGSVTTSTASVNPGSTIVYTVTGGTAGCTGTQTVQVTVNPIPTLTLTAAPATVCTGGTTTLTASGASTYTWSANAGGGSATTATVSPGGATIYTVSGTSLAGCIGSQTINVTVSPTPTVTISGTSTLCSGNPVVLTGATATTYTWGTGATTNTISVTPPTGTTTYTLTGANGPCTATAAITVTVTATPTLTISGTTSLCSGGSTILTGATAAGYTWSANAGSVNTSTVSVTPPVGTTNYTLTGANGICVTTKTISVVVSTTPTVAITGTSNLCSGNPVVLTGATATNYTWSTGATTNTISVTPPVGNTTYTLTGANGICTATTAITVTVTATPTLAVNSASICSGQSAVLTAATANTYTWSTGANTNTISVTPPVGTNTYTVTGDNGNGCTVVKTATVTVSATPTVAITGTSNLCSGNPVVLTGATATNYTWSTGATTNTISVTPPVGNTTYTLTGANGVCTATTAITVTVTATPTLAVNSASICSGQSAVLTAATANTYTWNTGATTNTISVTPPVGTNTYTVTGDNGNGCVVIKTATVTVNATPTVTISGAGPICSGTTIILTGAAATNYTWMPGGQITSTISVTPPAGTNTYTLTGANGTCTASAIAFVDVSPTPTITITGAAPICSGQSVVLSGGTASTYTWSANAGSVNTSTASVTPGGTTVYTLTGTTGSCTSSATTTVTVNTTPTLSLPSSTYTICNGSSTAISVNGATTFTWTTGTGLSCTLCANPNANPTTTTIYTVTGTTGTCLSAPATVTVNVNPLPTITAVPSSSTICSSNSSTITAGGANTYTWSPAGSLNSSTGTPVVATPTANTTYTITGTDVNGCVNTNTVTINVAPTPTLTINAVPGAVCAGQSVVLNGATATTYTWSANAGSVNTATATVTPSITDTYTLTGSIGTCTSSAVTTVTVNPVPIIGTASTTAAPCGQSTGCINSVSVSGGTPTFTYTWNGGTPSTSSQNCNIPAGSYTLLVTDANGCTATQIFSVANQNGPAAPTVAASGTIVCVGSTITLTVNPIVAGTTYTWTDITGTTPGTSYTVTNINPPGTYNISVTATDGNGCISAATIVPITVNALPTIAANASATFLCSGQTATLTATGATNYTWTPGGATTSTVSVTPGTNTIYTVTGDNNGCVSTQTVAIAVNPPLVITVNPSTNSICSSQSATLTASGASTFTWMPNGSTATTITVTPNTTTVYTVTGDSLGCTAQQQVTITVTATPTLTANASANTICSSQSATLTANGATNYTWTPGGTGGIITVTPNTNTIYTVTGANGTCVTTTTVNINVTPSPTVSTTASAPSVCAGQTATLTASGATNYTWTPTGANNDTLIDAPTSTTVYTVTGDNAGCTNSQQVTVTVNQLPTLAAVGNQTVCSGGQVNTINYSAGTATVNWTNSNINVGINANGTGTINGYTAPNVVTQETAIITATPMDAGTGCTGIAQSYTVIINPIPTALGGQTDSAKCGLLNGGVTGVTVSGGTPVYTYQWYNNGVIMTGETNPTLGNVGAGTYSVLITDANGCTAPASATTFTVSGSPAVIANITPPVSQGPAPLNVVFVNNTTGATFYSWNFGNGQTSSAQTPTAITYTAPGTYTVLLTATNGGCLDTDTAIVIIDAPVVINVPNVFSPNGDGINDDWFIQCTGIRDLHCDIFNRWGQLVYQLLAPNDVWNGVMNNGNHASEGTYYYVLEATGFDGKSYKSHGWLSLFK